MDFGLSGEEELFRDSVREFLRRELSGRWVEIDESGYIPADFIRGLASQGLLAIPVPEDYGGQGGSFTLAAIAAEELGRADPSMSTAVYTLLNNAWPFVLYLYGGERLKTEVLPLVGEGKGFFGIASTEPGGGSDIAGLRSEARRVAGGYRVSGEKMLISGVREALEQLDLGGWLLLARTGDPGERHRSLTAFALIAKSSGGIMDNLEYELVDTVGRRAISTGVLRLRGIFLGEDAVVGGEGRGFYVAMEGFNLARILVSAANVGAASYAVSRAIEWARERRLFGGRPIASFQGVSFPLAEIHAEIEASRLLAYKAAWVADRIYARRDKTYSVKDLAYYSAAAKMKSVETAFRAFEIAMKTLGGISYTKEVEVYRGMLSVLSYLVGAEGAQNIMRYIIARMAIGEEVTHT